jgi:hypothetical protein
MLICRLTEFTPSRGPRQSLPEHPTGLIQLLASALGILVHVQAPVGEKRAYWKLDGRFSPCLRSVL